MEFFINIEQNCKTQQQTVWYDNVFVFLPYGSMVDIYILAFLTYYKTFAGQKSFGATLANNCVYWEWMKSSIRVWHFSIGDMGSNILEI